MSGQIPTLASLLILSVSLNSTAQISLSSPTEPARPIEKRFNPETRLLSRFGFNPYQPIPLVSGPPLIQTKGIVRGDRFLYIADTGKGSSHNEPAKIWKLDPKTKELTVFYQGPLLVNAKWLYYRGDKDTSSAELFVSDYGVETTPRFPGTGEGAKVIAIPIDKDGNALEPHVLHSGAPLRSPEGITVVGDSVILADWAAGEETSLPDRPGKFLSGAVFQIPVSGGRPQRIFSEHTWVTLIGSCRYEGEDGKKYIRFIDLDAGRPDTSPDRPLPQSGTVGFFRTQILSEKPLRLGRLERVPLREEFLISLNLNGYLTTDTTLIKTSPGTRFLNGKSSYRARIAGLQDKPLELKVESETHLNNIKLDVAILRGRKLIDRKIVEIPKIIDKPITMMDNKHGGRVVRSAINQPRLMATADGTSRGLYFVQPSGGVPRILWRGDPFVQPMGVQYSWAGDKLWITDQAAGPNETSIIFESRLPSEEERLREFPQLKLQKRLPVQ